MYFLPLSNVLRKSSCELYEETSIAEHGGDASTSGTDVVTAVAHTGGGPFGDAAAKAWALSWFRSLASCGGTRSEPFHNPFQRFAGRKSSLEHFVENLLF